VGGAEDEGIGFQENGSLESASWPLPSPTSPVPATAKDSSCGSAACVMTAPAGSVTRQDAGEADSLVQVDCYSQANH